MRILRKIAEWMCNMIIGLLPKPAIKYMSYRDYGDASYKLLPIINGEEPYINKCYDYITSDEDYFLRSGNRGRYTSILTYVLNTKATEQNKRGALLDLSGIILKLIRNRGGWYAEGPRENRIICVGDDLDLFKEFVCITQNQMVRNKTYFYDDKVKFDYEQNESSGWDIVENKIMLYSKSRNSTEKVVAICAISQITDMCHFNKHNSGLFKKINCFNYDY